MPDKKQPTARIVVPIPFGSRRAWAEVMRDSSTSIAYKMELVSFDARFMQRADFYNLVQEVAQATGADPKQIANKATRTPEQQQALLEAAARRQLDGMDKFANSNYFAVLDLLQKTRSVFDPDPAKPGSHVDADDPDAWGFKESFLWYYFTTRPDLRPSEESSITDADKAAIIEAYKRFDGFILDFFGDIEKAKHCNDEEYLDAIEAFISAENPANAPEIIEHLTSILPERYVVPNNKLANTLTRGIIDIGRITLEESRKGAKKLVETTCILTYEGDKVKLSGRQPFTEYDRSVYNAVCSLFVYGDPAHVVTPAMVYRAMNGLTDSEKPTEGQIAAVTRSLDKMRFIRARIDCTDELKARRLTLNSEQINGGEIDTYLLTADAIKVQSGGQTVRAYRIIKTPILYEYAAAVKQVLTLPASMLEIKELNADGSPGARLPNTEARILLKGYLIRRIEGMKGKNGLNNPIIALYDYERDSEMHQGLYSIAGKPDAKDLEAKRIRTDVEKMLAYWQATGYIKGFEAQTQRRKITGYKITV